MDNIEDRNQKAEDRRQKTDVASLSSVLCFLFSVCVLLLGCQPDTACTQKMDGFYLNPHRDLRTIGRVAIVQLDNGSSYAEISADVTEALFLALQKKQAFGLTVVHQQDSAWRGLQLDLDSAYTLEQLSAIRRTLKCDAILVGVITQYRPYPHLTVGIRVKLIDVNSGELLWALEQVWDACDKATECRVKKYFERQMRSGSAALGEQLVTVSSLEFVRFVAYEVAETLPSAG
jgi:hypothetical protein